MERGLKFRNFRWKQWFKMKNIIMMNLFPKNMQLFASQDINCWTGVVWITCGLLWCFYQLFWLSFWRHPFTAEDPLVSKWCNATFLQICSDKETTRILDGLRVSKSSANLHFWVNYSFKIWDGFEEHRFCAKCVTGWSALQGVKTSWACQACSRAPFSKGRFKALGGSAYSKFFQCFWQMCFKLHI